jgi:hypothetical protein
MDVGKVGRGREAQQLPLDLKDKKFKKQGNVPKIKISFLNGSSILSILDRSVRL